MRKWVRPSAYEECFASNENIANSVSPCITGTIECVYPAQKASQIGDNGIYDGFNGIGYGQYNSGVFKDGKGLYHGACGTPTVINYSTSEGKGYEIYQGKLDRTRPISGISLTDYTLGMHDDVTWTSTGGKNTYHHKGRINISLVENSKPNHS